MPRNITISHSGSERILPSDEESSSGTGVQVASPSDGSQEYSDSVQEEEEEEDWTAVGYSDEELEPSDSASRPSSEPLRSHRHSSHRHHRHRAPPPVNYRTTHRSIPEEHVPRRSSYRKHVEHTNYRKHRDHRRPPSANSDSLDSRDDYPPGYARGPPLPHPHHQWAHVPSHPPPSGYGSSIVSSGGYNPFTGGMSHASSQLVPFSSHADPYGYSPHNPFSPSAHSQANPFSPAPSGASGAAGYFDHPRPGYPRAPPPMRAGEIMPYGASAGQYPYPYSHPYYYSSTPAESPPPHPVAVPPPPPARAYSRPRSIPHESGKSKEEEDRLAMLEKIILESKQKEAAAEAPKKEENQFSKLEALILAQKEEQIAREKAALAKAAEEKAAADAKIAKEAADKKAAEEAAQALLDAAAKARVDAETKAEEAAKKAKEEHEKKVKELEAAAEAAKIDADNARGPADAKKPPIKFKDAVGRKFSFPWHLCKTWKGMEELIKQAFVHVDIIGPHVQEGHYDLVGPDNEIILPQVWETMVQPDWSITMHMWPMPDPPEPKKSASRPTTPGAPGIPGSNIVVVEPAAQHRKKNGKKSSKHAITPASLTMPPIPPPPPVVPVSAPMPPPAPSMPMPPGALPDDLAGIAPPAGVMPANLGPLPSGVTVVMDKAHSKKKNKETVPPLLAFMAGRGRTQSTKKKKT